MNSSAKDQISSSSKSRPKRNLKQLLIEPFKQIKFGVYVLGLTSIFLGLLAVLFVSSFYEQYSQVMEIFQVVGVDEKRELITDRVFRENLAKLFVLIGLYIGSLFFLIFKLTHRYYGPLVSIERFIKAMSLGNYEERVAIRKKDELSALVNKLNVMAAKLEERHGSSAKPVFSDEATRQLVKEA